MTKAKIDWNNPEEVKAYKREVVKRWRENNPEKVKRWRENHSEQAKANTKKYLINNPEKRKEYSKRANMKNKEKRKEYYRSYKRNPEINMRYREGHREELRIIASNRYYDNQLILKTYNLIRTAIRLDYFDSPTLYKRTGYSLEEFKHKIIELNGELSHKGFSFYNLETSGDRSIKEILNPHNMYKVG